MELPKFISLRQMYDATPPVDIQQTIEKQLSELSHAGLHGASVAVGVGSRGITNLSEIVKTVVDQLKRFGALPFILPAMGSHGGATADGQLEVLESYGITESSMGVPIRASMDVDVVGYTDEKVPCYCAKEALKADSIFLINRIKPHTDFFGTLGSGLIKMCVIGLGKRTGAETMHLAATQYGYEHIIRAMAAVIVRETKLLGGLGILEDQLHQTAKLQFVRRHELESAEMKLLAQAKEFMPRIPFREFDLLIVDRIGKNISGAGMDPNVINRSIHGYSSLPIRPDDSDPFIRRIFVRGLTHETHGNAIGIGMADVTTTRLVQQTDMKKTVINSLTALTPQSAKLPITVDCDRQAIELMLKSLPISDTTKARIVRIEDTLSVAHMDVSESLWEEVQARNNMQSLSRLHEIEFDAEGNLID